MTVPATLRGKFSKFIYGIIRNMINSEKKTEKNHLMCLLKFLEKNPNEYKYDVGWCTIEASDGSNVEMIDRISIIDLEILKLSKHSKYSVLSKDCTFGIVLNCGFKVISLIVGINVNRTSELLMFSILYHERKETFKEEMDYFYEQFTTVVGEKILIIVDQDEGNIWGIEKASAQANINCTVRLCLWHLTQNFIKRIGGALRGNLDFNLGVPVDRMTKHGLLHIANLYDLKGLKTKPEDEIRKAVQEAMTKDNYGKLGTIILYFITSHYIS